MHAAVFAARQSHPARGDASSVQATAHAERVGRGPRGRAAPTSRSSWPSSNGRAWSGAPARADECCGTWSTRAFRRPASSSTPCSPTSGRRRPGCSRSERPHLEATPVRESDPHHGDPHAGDPHTGDPPETSRTSLVLEGGRLRRLPAGCSTRSSTRHPPPLRHQSTPLVPDAGSDYVARQRGATTRSSSTSSPTAATPDRATCCQKRSWFGIGLPVRDPARRVGAVRLPGLRGNRAA